MSNYINLYETMRIYGAKNKKNQTTCLNNSF
jgi:hypothetical protein